LEVQVDTDVLIVGAGPTGLMLANQLARRNINTLIIDQHPGPSLETRALGVQARTLEIYSHLGIVERAIELGKRGTGANIWAQGEHRARVALSDVGDKVTPYPFVLILGQDDNERIMGDHLRELGCSVQWNTELVSVTQQADSVTAVIKQAEGSQRKVVAAWVAGCDGARSTVRESCGIAFDGAPYEHVFFVADTEVTGRMVPDEVNIYLFQDGFHLLFPMRGKDHWRIVGILPPELRNKPDLRFEAVVPSLQNEAGDQLQIKSCSWFSTYRIHHRAAVHFRDRRCFLLGDAAHIHSPVGAQGMNTGLQDAYNLAWKLTLVIRSRPRRRCSIPMNRSGCPSRGPSCTERTVPSGLSFLTAGFPDCCVPEFCPDLPPLPRTVTLYNGWHFAQFRRPVSVTGRARSQNR